MSSKKTEASQPIVRCAIYTRKSTDERLDMQLNSLDSQRGAAESLVRRVGKKFEAQWIASIAVCPQRAVDRVVEVERELGVWPFQAQPNGVCRRDRLGRG